MQIIFHVCKLRQYFCYRQKAKTKKWIVQCNIYYIIILSKYIENISIYEHLAPCNLTYRLRLDNSIVSMSITWRCLNPIRTRFFSSSHPRPPAPTTSTLQWSRSICKLSGDGSKSGRQNGPDLSSTFRKLLHRLCRWSELIIAVRFDKFWPRIRVN